ncbi:MAG: retropepsin-like aspartic protease [Pyrinomonadaceae bacterium]
MAVALPLQLAAQESKQSSATRQRQVGSNARFASGNSALNIPLEIDNNIILMQVGVNNSKPLRFIFDTGASHTILHSRRGAELGLKPEEQVRGTATGGAIEGSLTSGVSLKVAGAEVSNQQIGMIDFPLPPGFEFDGVIGYDFINAFVVEIDYLKKIMNLYDPRTYLYRGRGEVIPLVLDDRRTPLAHVTITPPTGAPLNAVLEVDTGADRAFIFNNSFVKKHGLVAAMTNIKESAGRGAGGEQQIVIGRAKAAQLGRLVFTNPTVGLVRDPEPEGASKEGDGVIGGEIFRRFKVIIDYSRQRMILEPNKDLNDPYPVDPGE